MPKIAQRTTIRRHPERNVIDEFGAIVSAGDVAHVSFCIDGQPHIIPMTFQYDPSEPERIYLHGAQESRIMRTLAQGVPVCLCITHIDGRVYSKTAINHSMNYRSAICFGHTVEVTDPVVKRRAFVGMTKRYFPGRTENVDYEGATAAQLESTTMVSLEIEEGSAKARRGGPNGPTDADPNALGTCGVVKVP
jgi:uncharacterized protein